MRSTPSSSITRSSRPPVPQSPYSTTTRSWLLRPARILARTASGIRAGVLCSLAGRQVTSMCDQPFSAIRARTSRASAPQAISRVRGGRVPPLPGANVRAVTAGVAAGRTAMGWASGGRQRAHLAALAHLVVASRHHGLGGLDRDRRIAAIGIGTNCISERLVQRRAADQDDVVVADALLLH